jgi:hypothetical protein
LKKRFFPILLAAGALVACRLAPGEAPAPMPAMNQDAIKALGSTMPEPNFNISYWLKQYDTNTPEWQEAKRLCEQTVLANYPNCVPVNDIVQTDRRAKAAQADKSIAKNDEMFKRGYQYDFGRKEWFPYHEMQAAGCIYTYPSVGRMTWRCPLGATLPRGIPDSDFGREGE